MRLILSASSMRSAPTVKREIPGLLSAQRLSVIKNSLPFWWKDYRELGMKGIRQRIRFETARDDQSPRPQYRWKTAIPDGRHHPG